MILVNLIHSPKRKAFFDKNNFFTSHKFVMTSADEKGSVKLKGMSMHVKIHTSNSTLKFKSSIYFYYLVHCGGFLSVSYRPMGRGGGVLNP